jgi:hypothetical protein
MLIALDRAMQGNALSQIVLDKISEQVERADHLLSLIPPPSIEWRPMPGAMRVCDLLGHLLECLAGFCATLYALDRERLAHFARLRDLEVNHCCGIQEARLRIRDYMACIEEGFTTVTDEDLALSLPTVFAAEGETVLRLLLTNLEHFTNHKYQLFFYLKMMGASVGTGDLYRLRG